MLKVYCTECGSPTTYSAVKPKFCSGCGTPFDKVVVNKTLIEKPTFKRPEPPRRVIPKIQPKARVEEYEDDDDYDGDEVNYVPEISNLDCEIEASRPSKVRIGDVLGTGSKQNRNKSSSKKISKAQQKLENQKFMENWKKEAGSIRPKTRGQRDG
jgi:hypothetical protein